MAKYPFIQFRAVLVSLCTLLSLCTAQQAYGAGELSGYVAFEANLFAHAPLYEAQKNHAVSLSFKPEYYHEWQSGDRSVTFTPFIRLDSADPERTHFDIRELFMLSVYERFELGIGLRKIFWGVTESQHLVDIINQTDAVEATDGEEKLGAPMFSMSVQLESTANDNLGTLDIYILPWFRERTFIGKRGRLRGALRVDSDQTSYEADAEERHIDLAMRWSRSIGDYDIGLSYFTGTGRTPTLTVGTDSNGETVFIPRYILIDQAGIAVQKVHEDWLLKLEAIARSGEGDTYGAWTGGFEYSMSAVMGTHVDVGILGEWSHDTRGNGAATPLEDDLMFGLRIAVNDIGGTEALFGIVQDIDTSARSIFLESSKRYGDHLRISLEANIFSEIPANDLLFGLRDDDFVKFEAAYWF